MTTQPDTADDTQDTTLPLSSTLNTQPQSPSTFDSETVVDLSSHLVTQSNERRVMDDTSVYSEEEEEEDDDRSSSEENHVQRSPSLLKKYRWHLGFIVGFSLMEIQLFVFVLIQQTHLWLLLLNTAILCGLGALLALRLTLHFRRRIITPRERLAMLIEMIRSQATQDTPTDEEEQRSDDDWAHRMNFILLSSHLRRHGVRLNGDFFHQLQLSMMNRDFNERDYEMLLQLDRSGEQSATRGLSQEAISNFPTYQITDSHSKMLNETCTICLEPYAIGDECMILTCFHQYHADCASKWLEQKSTCPICLASQNMQEESTNV